MGLCQVAADVRGGGQAKVGQQVMCLLTTAPNPLTEGYYGTRDIAPNCSICYIRIEVSSFYWSIYSSMDTGFRRKDTRA